MTAQAHSALAEIIAEAANDLERRADACHDLNKSHLPPRDRMRLHGKESAYRHAMWMVRAAIAKATGEVER